MRILLLASHAIAEYDDLRMLSDLGHEVFCPGGYADPAHPAEAPATKAAGMGPLRPGLPLPYRAELDALCSAQRTKHDGESEAWAIDWAKADLHPDLVDWADAIIVHHYPDRWIGGQWRNIRHKRVIWRTCGQSGPDLEETMRHFVRLGLQVVRYSPREKIALERFGPFAGQDALIRFGKYPSDWYGWTGEDAVIGNLTQSMVERGPFTGYSFYAAATEGLPTRPAGGGSEELPGGVGLLSYDAMREYLRRVCVVLYTGTAPASYTLGLIEAMMTGTPVVSIGPDALWPVYRELFEGHEIAVHSSADPAEARRLLKQHLSAAADDWQRESAQTRRRAIDLFGIGTIGPQWQAFLGASAVAVPELVAASA